MKKRILSAAVLVALITGLQPHIALAQIPVVGGPVNVKAMVQEFEALAKALRYEISISERAAGGHPLRQQRSTITVSDDKPSFMASMDTMSYVAGCDPKSVPVLLTNANLVTGELFSLTRQKGDSRVINFTWDITKLMSLQKGNAGECVVDLPLLAGEKGAIALDLQLGESKAFTTGLYEFVVKHTH